MAIEKKPCPSCREKGNDRSGDNLVVYGNDCGAHCFACGYHVHGKGMGGDEVKPVADLKKVIRGKIMAIPSRKIPEKTARMYDYRLAKVGGQVVHVENFFRDGKLVAQHIRTPEKKFYWKGDTSNLPLFGQHLWNGRGKRIVVTEGALDCMSIAAIWDNRWPVVSVASGANHALKNIKANLEFLSGYDEIVLAFDMDEAGQEAAMLCAEALPPGKVRIASLPFKDANKCLMEGQAKQLLTAIYEARTYQPDGILHARDVSNSPTVGQEVWTFPWPCLTTGFLGQRSGEITLWASGTGSGKSTVMREIALHHLIRGRPVGMLMLEESPRETLDDLIALHLGKPVRQIKASRELNEVLVAEGEDTLDFGFADDLTDEQYDEAREFISSLPLYIYDHAGTNKFDNLIQRVEYMAVSLGCKVIIIDHVTAVIAGMDRNGSEREAIDEMMKTLRSLVERTGVHLDIVSQLNRLEGKGAEEGGQISLKNLRGSGSLGSVPNNVIAIERNQQSEDPKERNIMKVRSLKGRFTGTTGIAGYLRFNHTTRRIEQATWTERTEDDNAGSTFKSHDRPECTEVQAEEALDGLLDEEPVAQDRALEAHVG